MNRGFGGAIEPGMLVSSRTSVALIISTVPVYLRFAYHFCGEEEWWTQHTNSSGASESAFSGWDWWILMIYPGCVWSNNSSSSYYVSLYVSAPCTLTSSWNIYRSKTAWHYIGNIVGIDITDYVIVQ